MNLRNTAFVPAIVALFITFIVIGCAASDDMTTEEEAVSLNSDTAVVVEQAPSATPTSYELQQELDAIKTENFQLKQKLTAAENSNRALLSKASDLEAAIAAREQSAKAGSSKTLDVEATQREKKGKSITRSFEGVTERSDVRIYESAVNMVKKGLFTEAIAKFELLLNTAIKEDYAPNCRHWMGLAFYGLKDYQSALEQFNGVSEFKFSTKKEDAQLMIAQCYEKMGDVKRARTEYEKLVRTYPAGQHVDRAKKKARTL